VLAIIFMNDLSPTRAAAPLPQVHPAMLDLTYAPDAALRFDDRGEWFGEPDTRQGTGIPGPPMSEVTRSGHAIPTGTDAAAAPHRRRRT
jgi:hypothetical protein